MLITARRILAGSTAIALTVAGVVVLPSAAHADSVAAVFNYTGGDQTWKVPDGVTNIEVVAYGASGGAGGTSSVSPFPAGGPGGRGALVTVSSLAVTPGQNLTVRVGGQGKSLAEGGAGGYPNGGSGISTSIGNPPNGGGGGGSSSLWLGIAALVFAGGGGGGGSAATAIVGAVGGNAGAPNATAGGTTGGSATGGGGGRTSSPAGGGAGGTSSNLAWTGSAGTYNQGGRTAVTTFGGGGGGGGFYGGGGGTFGLSGTGGGGGSSYAAPGSTANFYNYDTPGNGQIFITWTPPNHTVTFNKNGGTGSMTNQVDNVPTALKANTFTRAGYRFTGWSTTPVVAGTTYANKAKYSFASNTTLYAKWVKMLAQTPANACVIQPAGTRITKNAVRNLMKVGCKTNANQMVGVRFTVISPSAASGVALLRCAKAGVAPIAPIATGYGNGYRKCANRAMQLKTATKSATIRIQWFAPKTTTHLAYSVTRSYTIN